MRVPTCIEWISSFPGNDKRGKLVLELQSLQQHQIVTLVNFTDTTVDCLTKIQVKCRSLIHIWVTVWKLVGHDN
ncbi:hypothetical protein Y032_0061g3241 [Ancylostoma ceylanicum]|uniref:Uncharacterized protein n=1 Tax=Ancylostoma ceylanicum TaxID=53326 RepID=A0A016U1R7_9BILA|nr:hypothetical protein Y032_0061g3241 [Ancylostoma ceylanicum]